MSVIQIITGALCIVVGLTLQMQVTLFSSADYLGLRLNATDLLLPFAGTAILWTLLSSRSVWPQWPVKKLYSWLAGLTLILTAALINTHVSYGEISRWALVNKYGGWIALLALFGLGGWISANARESQKTLFVRVFLYTGILTLFVQCFILLAWAYPIHHLHYPSHQDWVSYPIEGFMANRNAYGLLVATLVSFVTCFYLSNQNLLKAWAAHLLYFVLPFFVIYSGSRAATITLAILIPCIFLASLRHWKKILRLAFFTGLGFSLFLAAYNYRPERIFFFQMQTYEVLKIESISEGEKELSYEGDTMRIDILQDAKDMVFKNPVLGSGLGSVMIEQKIKYNKVINIIDSTPLWLLVELGALGLLAFSCFYVAVIKKLYDRLKDSEDREKAYLTGLLFMIFGFTLMCLVHEMMYTRHIWFLLGFGLMLPTRTHPNV